MAVSRAQTGTTAAYSSNFWRRLASADAGFTAWATRSLAGCLASDQTIDRFRNYEYIILLI
jgi:hypothetical protein